MKKSTLILVCAIAALVAAGWLVGGWAGLGLLVAAAGLAGAPVVIIWKERRK